MILVKCNNPNCNAEYEIDNKDYLEFMRKNANPMAMESPAMKCEKCGENSVFKAVKCEKCGNVFFWGNPTDFADRCPKCGYSGMEDARKKAAQESPEPQESQ
jgi:ribosomal protein L40E